MKTILVVEDDVSILRGLYDNLKFEGYKILSASEGYEGLRLALEESPDMIILDIMLPGLNGYDICRKVKDKKPDIPIIMLTTESNPELKEKGQALGVKAWMLKPFNKKKFFMAVKKLMA